MSKQLKQIEKLIYSNRKRKKMSKQLKQLEELEGKLDQLSADLNEISDTLFDVKEYLQEKDEKKDGCSFDFCSSFNNIQDQEDQLQQEEEEEEELEDQLQEEEDQLQEEEDQLQEEEDQLQEEEEEEEDEKEIEEEYIVDFESTKSYIDFKDFQEIKEFIDDARNDSLYDGVEIVEIDFYSMEENFFRLSLAVRLFSKRDVKEIKRYFNQEKKQRNLKVRLSLRK